MAMAMYMAEIIEKDTLVKLLLAVANDSKNPFHSPNLIVNRCTHLGDHCCCCSDERMR